MSLYFLDTSAILKRYVEERGSDWVTRICAQNDIVVSALTYAEIASSVARRHREGSLGLTRPTAVLDLYGDDTQAIWVIAVRSRVVRDAADLLLQSPAAITLRAFDALQLACARHAQSRAIRRGAGNLTFVSSDHRLLAAAEWAGLAVDNPEDHADNTP